MSLFNPYKFRGKVYSTPQQVLDAKHEASVSDIKNRRGIRGMVGSLLVKRAKLAKNASKEMKETW